MNQVITNDAHESLFSKFLKEWVEWSVSGREPVDASLSMRYWLDLQEARLEDHHLSCRVNVECDGHVYSAHRVSSGIPFLNRINLYNEFTYYQLVSRKMEYVRYGRVVHELSDYVSFYETIVDKPHSHDASFICPNCGGKSLLSVVERSGCPYCSTHYVMSDLFPKVTNFFCIDGGGIAEKSFKVSVRKMRICALIASFGMNIFFSVRDGFQPLWFVFSCGMGFCIFFVIFYFGYSLFLLGRLLRLSGRSIQLMNACSGTKRRISREISKFDPTFNYEYFESKALSLARLEIFSKEEFDSIVDIKYRGGFRLNDYSVSNETIFLNLDLFVVITVDDGDDVSEEDAVIHLSMCHNTHFPIDETFNISKVQCEHCGGSFDAYKNSVCPFCNQEYNVENKDWKVLSISVSE